MYALSVFKRSAAASVATTSRSATATVTTRLYSSTMHDNDPEVIEQEKQRNLRKEQHKTSSPIRNAPGWNQTLASESEAAIKADRSETPVDEITEHTLRYIKERHHTVESTTATPEQVPPSGSKSGSVNEERIDAREASYERDEISGPLSGTEGEVKKKNAAGLGKKSVASGL